MFETVFEYSETTVGGASVSGCVGSAERLRQCLYATSVQFKTHKLTTTPGIEYVPLSWLAYRGRTPGADEHLPRRPADAVLYYDCGSPAHTRCWRDFRTLWPMLQHAAGGLNGQ